MNIDEIKSLGYEHFKRFVKADALTDLRDFVHSRNEAFINKEVNQTPKPYTSNKIVQENRFTNLKREWDATTRNLLKILKGKTIEDRLLNIIWYRAFRIKRKPIFINFLTTDNLEKERLLKVIDEDDAAYKKSNGAYMISVTNRIMIESGKNPIDYFQDYYDDWKRFFLIDVVDIVKRGEDIPVKGLPSLGKFFIYQIMVDLTYQPDYPLTENDFVISGPGCERGLDELFEGFKKENFSYNDMLRVVWIYAKEFLDVSDWADFFKYPEDFPVFQNDFSLANVENLFCEFHKYRKIKATAGTKVNVKTRKYGN